MEITADALLTAALIFILRVANNGIGTIRLIVMARQQRGLAVALAFVEALTFAITVAVVATDLSNLLNLFVYCAGFATGNWLGMVIEARFITSFMSVNVIASEKGHEIATKLREKGYGVTEIIGEGLQGKVTMLRSIVNRRDVPILMQVIESMNPKAFVAIEEARTVARGTVRRVVNNQPTV